MVAAPRAVSVVVPAYNAEATLGDTLAALTAQRELALAPQIIVVDDGSSDGTANVVRRFPAVTLIQQENAGPGAARNAGACMATGDVILFTDSDCVPRDDWVAAMLRGFDDPEVALVMGRSVTLREATYVARVQQGSDYVALEAGPVTRFNSNNLGLRSDVARALPFDAALRIYGEDSDLGWRVRLAGHKTLYLPDAEVEHRHDHTYRSFLREAYLQGWGAARLYYKHGKWVPRDLLFGILAVVLLALAAIAPTGGGLLALAGAVSFGLFLVALMFNELFYKRKSLLLACWTFPLQVCWYGFKLCGYFHMLARVLIGREPAVAASKRAFRGRRADAN